METITLCECSNVRCRYVWQGRRDRVCARCGAAAAISTGPCGALVARLSVMQWTDDPVLLAERASK